MTIEVLDPTFGESAEPLVRAERASSLAGLTVAIISNGKHGTVPFFATLGDQLRTQHGVAEIVLLTKGNYSAPAELAVMNEAARWQAIITGVGD